MRKSNDLHKKIVHLVIPIAFQQFMFALVGACDALMLGKLHQNAMSAVSLATQVTFVFNLFMTAFIIGENMFVAQYYGKKDYANISRVVNFVLCISCFVAVIFMIGTIFFPENIMRFLTNESELIVMGGEYLRWVGVSYLLSVPAQIYLTVMKNCDVVALSTVISSMTVFLDICLNAVLIFGLFGFPAFGVKGAALATVIVTAVQLLWSIFGITTKMKWLKFPLFLRTAKKENALQRDDLTKRFFAKVGPVLLNELIWGGGFAMYSVIMGHLGTDAVAANSIANISKNLVVCLCLGLGSAGSIIVGNELGAEHFEEAKKAGGTLEKAAILCGILSGAVLLALSPVITKLVYLTPDAKAYLQKMLIMCSYYLVGKSVNSMTVGGIFPAGGDSKFGLFCDTVTLWCITIPLGCLCAFVWKLPVTVVYFVLNLDEIIKLPAVYKHYKKYGWVKNITER